MPVQILIDENDTIDAIISAPQTTVEIIANLVRHGDTIELNNMHVEKLTSEFLDRKQRDRLCEEFCRHYGVDKLIVRGGRRTTGRFAGKFPRPFVYRRAKS